MGRRMVKIPKHIQNAMNKSAQYHQKARDHQSIFETWIEVNYGEEVLCDDGIRDTIIDAIEQSNNHGEAVSKISTMIEELVNK